LTQAIACEGAPRDLGLDQGRACRDGLQQRFAALPMWRRAALWMGWPETGTQASLRQLARHFPHQHETLQGLAVGARVPAAWLAELLHAELEREGAQQPLAFALAAAEAAAIGADSPASDFAGGTLVRALEGPWVVRRSQPEGLFASVELSHPWLPCALAGVNERGLAVMVVTRPGSGGGAAPGVFLGQDCLERFERIEGALEWGRGRPGGGSSVILLADAVGEVAGIEIAGAERRILRPADGRLLCGGDPGQAAELAKRLGDSSDPVLPGLIVVANAARRSLRVDGEVFAL